MISKDDINARIDSIKDKLDETTSAIIADDLVELKSIYATNYDEAVEKDQKILDNQAEITSLQKANNKLYQRIGFDNVDVNPQPTFNINESSSEPPLRIEDVINEKGDLI